MKSAPFIRFLHQINAIIGSIVNYKNTHTCETAAPSLVGRNVNKNLAIGRYRCLGEGGGRVRESEGAK